MSIRARVVVRSLPLMLATGCHSLRPVTVGASRGKVVRVDFRAPRTVSVSGRGASALQVDSVTRLEGRVVAVRGDTLEVALGDLWRPREPVRDLPVGAHATVVPGPDDRLRHVRTEVVATVLTMALVATAFVGIVFAAWASSNDSIFE